MASSYIDPSLSDREACIDAVHRFVNGIDWNDGELIASAWTRDAEFDLSDIANLGIGGRQAGSKDVVTGRDAIRDRLLASVGPLDTTHMVTNPRVRLNQDGRSASLTALALAQHYRTGEARDVSKPGCLMGNSYTVTLEKDTDGFWKMAKFVLKAVWWEGDKSVLGA